MHNTWLGNPSLRQRSEARPRHAVALAPSPEGATPIPFDLYLYVLQSLNIAWHAVIIVGSVSKVEMATPMGLLYKALFPSLSTFETPPALQPQSPVETVEKP